MVIFHSYVKLPEGSIPQMLAYIPAPWILWAMEKMGDFFTTKHGRLG